MSTGVNLKMRENSFYTNLWSIALPVTMQSLLQSSFSMINQVMIGSLVLSATLVLLAPAYVRIYQVEPQVRELTRQILIAFAIIAPVKVQNMIKLAFWLVPFWRRV